mgnify:CR=1 FL=1|tara:strand:- start:40 stop:381 length:342 start_codon:yes stop_codon:yes gene_type:complete
MSIIDSDLIRKNALFAIANVQTTLTAVAPTNTATYVCNRQQAEESFIVFEDGRETSIDTKFYLTITATDHTESQLPKKGFVLTDGTDNFKVIGISRDAKNVTIRLDCKAEGQR